MKKLLALLLSAALVGAACSDSYSDDPLAGPTDGGEDAAADGSDTGEAAEVVPEEDGSGDTTTGAEGATEPEAPEEVHQLCQVDLLDTGDGAEAGMLPIDPAVRIGTLGNGLTFYLRSNPYPADNLSLRLVVDAGSLHDPYPGAGHANFVEYMLFDGTEDYPGNELTEALQSIGVEFGPDVNARATHDETVYELDLVIDEAEQSVDTAFHVLSQWAHAATLSPDDVEKERGIVRDEYRRRVETGFGTIVAVFDRVYTQGTPYEGRLPIGTVEGIETTTAEELRDFYDAWYVPSNMAVVAVGDLPLDRLEELVVAYFCDIPGGQSPPAPDQDSALNPTPEFAVATTPEQAYSYLSLDVRVPSWDPSTIDGDRRLWTEEVMAIMVENILADGYEQGMLAQIDPTFLDDFNYTQGLRYYGTNLRADDFSAALTAYISLLHSIREHGFTDEHLARAATAIRADLESALLAESGTLHSDYAASYASHFLSGGDIGPVSARVERVSALLEELRADDLTDRYRGLLDTSGLILIAVGADPADVPTVEEMQAAVAAAEPGDLPAAVVEVDELVLSPSPVDPVSSGPIPSVAEELEQAYEWSFANGARAMFVQSDSTRNEVSVQAFSWGGYSILSEGDRLVAQYLAPRAVGNSGLGELSPSQISRYLDDRNVQVQPFIRETREGVIGSSDSGDLRTLLQLVHLYKTAARVDEQAFDEAANVGDIIGSLKTTDPDWQEHLAYLEARHGDAFGWFDLDTSPATLDSLTPGGLLDLYRQRLGDVDDLVVLIVGDVDLDTVDLLVRTYVGTLPAGEADSFVNRRSPEPDGVIRREVVLGPDNQATEATYYYEAPTALSPALQATADVLEALVDARLNDVIQEQGGESYAVSAQIRLQLTPEQGVSSEVTASGDPEQMGTIEAEMARVLADIFAGDIDEAAFEQARSVVADDYDVVTNDELITMLLWRAVQGDGDPPTPQRLTDELADLDLADVQALAGLLFDPDQHIQVARILP
ncbi:M16 family metallopeptidase [Candidatus Poriferisocius sp.]|uniref:M16 family metallopeptidase n=1 Tax=Candidatus Poriferisocius sp. TaxID=3101276 RepID=UPI003B5BAD74